MNIKELSKWADDQVFYQTGNRLSSLQKSILEGVLQSQDFCEIKDNNGYSYDHIKREGAKLWKLLSEIFKEDIKQSNVRSILENQATSTIYNYGNSSQIISSNINSHINICKENSQYLEDIQNQSSYSQNQTPRIDLSKAPELNYKYGRTSEIATLKQWILENHTRLITIYGLSGIGKTALTLKLISEITTQFDYIIYRSLDNLPKLINLKNDLQQFLSQSQNPLPEILDYLKSSRCLIILDDVENIFQFGNLAGQYLTEYKDYSRFFQQIATSHHESCVILISCEKPAAIETLESENQHTKTLHLQGLGEDAKAILKEKDLKDDDKWDELIKLYQGHPCWLNIITLAIKELFNGQVSQFLIDEDEVFLGDIEALLENHLERLSDLEKQVINWFAMLDEPIDISQKLAELELSNARFLKVLQSLNRRCLVEKVLIEEKVKFQVNSLVRIYLNN
ncbi:NB-ARC domain-containing protein [Sphaerospermopsis torques-reginae]|uniref:NACHT domain-containing protein n=1 Tax=Sphaerospermopsis torques-reginae ITEP-024 TaxID=984208 RepID=A0ABX8X2H1_9CYAN|nr:NB-ARC domain-containing protein [Sphaerospermopsis torques-reginae]QYX32846.1 NACHT domain-containing protein [Sphaerospermopsis torques-reginae ITEP-024]